MLVGVKDDHFEVSHFPVEAQRVAGAQLGAEQQRQHQGQFGLGKQHQHSPQRQQASTGNLRTHMCGLESKCGLDD